MLDNNFDAFLVGCENIGKTAPGYIAMPLETAPDPLKEIVCFAKLNARVQTLEKNTNNI